MSPSKLPQKRQAFVALGALLLASACAPSSIQPAAGPKAAHVAAEAFRPDRSAAQSTGGLSASEVEAGEAQTTPSILSFFNRPTSPGEFASDSIDGAIAPRAGPENGLKNGKANGHDLVEEAAFRPTLRIADGSASPLDDLPAGAEAGFVVFDIERGSPIAEQGGGRGLLPASTVKLATALVALDVLGPAHRYRTELHAAGPIEAGVLRGDLILKGGGDPLLDIVDLIGLARELRQWGVRKVAGRFLIDDASLPRLTEITPTQPLEAAYNPGVGALSLSFNRVHLSWEGKGEPAVATVPMLDEALFERAARDALPPSGVQLKRSEEGRVHWQLADRGARRTIRSLPVKDPGLHAGRVFVDMAAMSGVELPPPARAAMPPGARLMTVHESRPLRALVRDMLWYSSNLMAEMIGLSVAQATVPSVDSLEVSASVLLGHLQRLLPEIDWSGAALRNHSGLDSEARLTPRQLAAILRLGWENGSLNDLLPIGGWSGTMARRFAGQDEALRVWAKTGSLNYGISLSGYLLSPSHGPAAFAIMISDVDARAAYDALPRRTRGAEQHANQWHEKVRAIMDRVVQGWLAPPADAIAKRGVPPGQA